MQNSAQAIWWVFILGVLSAAVLLAGVVGTIVVSHRRYMKLHRDQSRKVLEAQEEERAWVAREVHDDAVQRLMLIGREADASREAIERVVPEQALRLTALQAELKDLSDFLRGLAHRLHPSQLDRGGLCTALKGLAEELGRSYGIQVTLELPSTPPVLTPHRALALFRVAQEALQNVVKHARVSAAQLVLAQNADGVQLTVSDQGAGFDAATPKGEGIGLIGIKERAYLAEGEVDISSARGQGTVVRVWLPNESHS